MPFAAWVFHVQYHQIKGAAKKTVEWCYILTYLHTDTLHPYTGAARVQMYYQRCSKRTSGATHIYIYIYIYIFMYLHYILTGAAMYHQRCCKKYLPVLTAQVLPKYQCTTWAQLLPPLTGRQVFRRKGRKEWSISSCSVLEPSSECPGSWFGDLATTCMCFQFEVPGAARVPQTTTMNHVLLPCRYQYVQTEGVLLPSWYYMNSFMQSGCWWRCIHDEMDEMMRWMTVHLHGWEYGMFEGIMPTPGLLVIVVCVWL